jgi:hypothetical protein
METMPDREPEASALVESDRERKPTLGMLPSGSGHIEIIREVVGTLSEKAQTPEKLVNAVVRLATETNPELKTISASDKRKTQGMWISGSLSALFGLGGIGSLIFGASLIAGVGAICLSAVCAGGYLALASGSTVHPNDFTNMFKGVAESLSTFTKTSEGDDSDEPKRAQESPTDPR